MTQINPNINNNLYQGQAAGPSAPYLAQQPAVQPVRIPNYYYIPDGYEPKSFKEAMEDNPAASMAYDMVLKQFIEHPVATLATWLGLGVGIDAYAKACRGKYENSLVKKAANLGDSIQESKLIQNKPVQWVLGGFKSVGNAGSKAVKNSAILRAIKDTPSMPEWSMVKSQMFDQKQEVVQDFLRITDALKLNEAKGIKLKDLGLDKSEKEMLKKVFKVSSISDIPEESAAKQVILKRLGRTQAQIDKIKGIEAVKAEVLKEMGLSKDKIKLIKEDVFGKYVDDVMQATKRVQGKVKMGTGHYGWMGPLTKGFERSISCDEIYNKLYSMSKGGAKTATGRFTSKMMQMLHRGFTFGGGKLGALLFLAPILVEVGVNVGKADKDQKVGTAASGLVENVSWVFTFPLALRMMHALGGVQYAGMTKPQVEAFRDSLQKFNEKALAGGFKSKEEYNAAKKAVKDMLKVKNQNFFTKGVRKLGQFLTMDLEFARSYHGSNPVTNLVRSSSTIFRNMGGVPMRLILWGLLSMGLLGGALTKCTTAIFGKSYDAMKQDERKDEKKQQKQFLKEDLNRRIYELAQKNAASQTPTTANKTQKTGNGLASRGKSEYSALTPEIQNKIKAGSPVIVDSDVKVDNYSYIPSSENIIPSPKKQGSVDNYTYIPSSECTIKSDKQNENMRKYIPSQAAANIQKTFDNSGLQSALDRAQRAEDKALRVLAGNFDGM